MKKISVYLQMLAVVFVHNSKENADKYVHADNDENNKEQAGPWVIVIGWHPVQKDMALDQLVYLWYMPLSSNNVL